MDAGDVVAARLDDPVCRLREPCGLEELVEDALAVAVEDAGRDDVRPQLGPRGQRKGQGLQVFPRLVRPGRHSPVQVRVAELLWPLLDLPRQALLVLVALFVVLLLLLALQGYVLFLGLCPDVDRRDEDEGCVMFQSGDFQVLDDTLDFVQVGAVQVVDDQGACQHVFQELLLAAACHHAFDAQGRCQLCARFVPLDRHGAKEPVLLAQDAP
mmetsp:Transcript_23458/g.73127  ORF Transcript_23458/g.73127 Transcript_23458/m.73127 type:complete len:212 (-) Transcript_23458:127-762(-)